MSKSIFKSVVIMYAYVTPRSTSQLKCTQFSLGISVFKNFSSCSLKCKHMTLAISVLNNIFRFAY